MSAPLGAPQGTSPMHQGAEELGWVPEAFEDPCGGNGYPERLLGPCPHTVTHKSNALTAQTRGAAETRRGRSSRRGLTGGPRRRGEGSLLTPTRTWPGSNRNSSTQTGVANDGDARGSRTRRRSSARQAGTRGPLPRCLHLDTPLLQQGNHRELK